MNISSLPLVALLTAMAGCSSRSEENYQRLLRLAGIRESAPMHRIEFIKTAGIDPYYLAKIEVSSIVSPSDIFHSPADWSLQSDRLISAPSEIRWWQPSELDQVSVWTPKKNEPPSYTEVIVGESHGTSIIYIAWQKHTHF
jgi:hypothetical protein